MGNTPPGSFENFAMAALVILALLLCSFASIQTATASKAVAAPKGERVARLSSALFFRNLRDDTICQMNKCLFWFPMDSVHQPGLHRYLLDSFSIVDQLFRPDWSLIDASAYQILFVYEKIKEFVRVRGRFPESLGAFLGKYGHILNGLETKLVIRANERLINDELGQFRGALTKKQLSLKDALNNPDLCFHWNCICNALNRLELQFPTSNTDGLEETLIAEAMNCGIPWSFLPSPVGHDSAKQRQQLFLILKAHLSARLFKSSSALGCIITALFGNLDNICALETGPLSRTAAVWASNYRGLEERDDYEGSLIPRMWAREDAAVIFQELRLKIQWDLATSPFSILAYDPENEFYLHDLGMQQKTEFHEFLYQCVRFDDTFSRRTFEEKLFKNFLLICDPNASHPVNHMDDILVAVINLAVARKKMDTAERLLQFGVERQSSFANTVYDATKNSNFVFEGPLVEMYVRNLPVVSNQIWGKIISSAVVRDDAELLKLLSSKLNCMDEHEFLPYIDFPNTSFYVYRYFRIFNNGTDYDLIERMRSFMDFWHLKDIFSDPDDLWHYYSAYLSKAPVVNFILQPQLQRFDSETFLHLPTLDENGNIIVP